jgi:preprotein translocase subunit SecA
VVKHHSELPTAGTNQVPAVVSSGTVTQGSGTLHQTRTIIAVDREPTQPQVRGLPNRQRRRLQHQLTSVLSHDSSVQGMSDVELREAYAELVVRQAAVTSPADITWAFALIRDAARRVLGQHPYPEQVLAGLAIASGCIAELATGEGKTLSATMPVAWLATAGKGVYVATSNDYLAQRDAQWMGRVYDSLGLTTCTSSPGMSLDEIQTAYSADITYSTAQQFGFDFLKDRMALNKEDLAQRGHFAAVIDEADSLLIDEARTALIMSGPDQRANPDYASAAKWASTLIVDEDYLVDYEKQETALGPDGAGKAETFFGVDNLYEDPSLVALTHTALKAEALYKRGRDYIVGGDTPDSQTTNEVSNRAVVVVDTKTGRALPSRRFQEGIHEALEAKEGLTPKQPQITYTSITIPGFFGRFEHFGGMTGTALSDSAELLRTYGTPVAQIPPHRPRIRLDHPDQLYVNKEIKHQALLVEVERRHSIGQPVLIGTPSVGEAKDVSDMLTAAGVEHALLSAEHHAEEAAIIAQAGRLGAVTVATNMAGRGVDIKLGGDPVPMELTQPMSPHDTDAFAQEYAAVVAAGGLAVIGTARHDARRVDDQLRGRAGRQGEPGESTFLLACDDELIANFGGQSAQQLLGRLGYGTSGSPITNPALTKLVETCQRKVEDYYAEARDNLLKYDRVVHAQRDAFWSWREQLLDLTFTEYAELILRNALQGRLDDAQVGNVTQMDTDELATVLGDLWPFDLPEGTVEAMDVSELLDSLTAAGLGELQVKYNEIPQEASTMVMRHVLLQNLDMAWAQHLRDLELVQTLVGLRQYSQQDPRTVFANEAADLFSHHLDVSYATALRLLWDTTPSYRQDSDDQPIYV